MQIRFMGGAGTVTGSKHLIETGGRRILVDCGLFQGEVRARNWQSLGIAPSSIDAVVLTHAHLDHSGYLPVLVKQGFAGRVFASDATVELATVLLRDSAHIQEEDADHANRHRYSRHRPALPLYTDHDARTAIRRFTAIPWHSGHYLGGGVTTELHRAGHILGAAWVSLRAEGLRIVFSGDLGRQEDPLLSAPEPIGPADVIVVESTYGDRLHPPADVRDELAKIVQTTMARGGVLLIPAFAVGRAQLLLLHLHELRKSGAIPDVPIFLNSPMATDAREIFCAHPADHRLDIATCRGMCHIAKVVRDVADSKALNERRGPMIIVSASGMLSGGRVLHHLKTFGPDPKSTILLAGYQAIGTRGRVLADGGRTLRVHGESIVVRAEIAALPALSAHADADELIAWLATSTTRPRVVYVTHGEPDSSRALAARIERELGWAAVVPSQGDEASFEPGTAVPESPNKAPLPEPTVDTPCCQR